jgi:methyl-accepting chemotaxis protein
MEGKMRFRNFGLKTKIVISSIAPAILAIVVGSLGMGSLYMLARAHTDAHEIQEAIQEATSIEAAAVAMAAAKRAYEVTGESRFLKIYERESRVVREGLEILKKREARNGANAQLLADAEKTFETWRQEKLDSVVKRNKPPSDSEARPEAQPGVSTTKGQDPGDAFTGIVNRLKKGQQTLLAQRIRSASSWIGNAEIIVYPGVAIIVIVGLFQSYAVGRQISNAVGRATTLAEAVSKGDLSSRVPVENSDEVGRLSGALNDMAESLTDQTRRIMEGVQILASSSAEISTASSQLSETASKTASAVTETMTTVEEVKQAAKVSSDKAQGVEERSKQAVEISAEGQRASKDTALKMDLIKEKISTVGDSVVTLSEDTQDIEEIISAVQDLADQSNLLAVNASIEAARAGDQGKGFAIVAQEIKSLSDQSRQATDQVRTILDQIRRSVSAVVVATDHGSKAVDEGVVQSASAGKSIQSLSGNIVESSQDASVIAASSEQQFVGVDQVSTAMDSIQTAMTQNVEGTKQLESEAEKLAYLGVTLKSLVEDYKL